MKNNNLFFFAAFFLLPSLLLYPQGIRPQITTVPTTEPTAAASASTSSHARYGLPDCAGQLVEHPGYISCQDTQAKIPRWVAYSLSAADLIARRDRAGKWHPAAGVDTDAQAKDSDYTRSGYDRGHLAPSADFVRSAEAMQQTFVFSNCAPQVGKGFNRHIWKDLEAQVRTWARQREEVWIYTGVIDSDPSNHIKNAVAIPERWYKIIFDPDPKPTVIAFEFSNKAYQGNKFMQYTTTVDAIEAKTGLDFLASLDDKIENKIEVEKKVWK